MNAEVVEVLRAARWLVDIHADANSIVPGSALWEDIKSLEAALDAIPEAKPPVADEYDWPLVVLAST